MGDAGIRSETVYRPRGALDLARTLAIQRRGVNDPTYLQDGAVIWRASRTPDGTATLAMQQLADGCVRAVAWGAGREWALAQLPSLCGAEDHADDFDAGLHPLIADAHRRHPGLRLSRTDLVFDALACAIMEQKITGMQAFGAWRRIVTWFGERAPGPAPRPMFAPPTPAQWRMIPSWAWHHAGLEPPQSRTIVRAAASAESIAREVTAPGPRSDDVLQSLAGVSAWTSAETRIRAVGDADAVSVGDFHLAHHVGFALTGSRTDDAGMLALLAPWAGQRQRVIRLITASRATAPRHGPRLHPEDHRAR